MPVVELAKLHLTTSSPPPETLPSTLIPKLTHAKTTMQTSSQNSFAYYRCIEDPSKIFILGAWPSPAFHMQDFIPSAANQEILETLKNDLTVKWMFHVDLPPLVDRLPKNRNVIAIVRHFVAADNKAAFAATFEANRGALEAYIGGEEYVNGGWRVDDGYDPEVEGKGGERDEEFVVVSSWENVQQHSDFAATEGFARYGRIREYIRGAEICHAHKLDI